MARAGGGDFLPCSPGGWGVEFSASFLCSSPLADVLGSVGGGARIQAETSESAWAIGSVLERQQGKTEFQTPDPLPLSP